MEIGGIAVEQADQRFEIALRVEPEKAVLVRQRLAVLLLGDAADEMIVPEEGELSRQASAGFLAAII